MKWRTSRFQLGCARVRTDGRSVMLPAAPSEPGPSYDESNRGGGQPFKDQELNHCRREDDLGSGRYRCNGRYADYPASNDQPIPDR